MNSNKCLFLFNKQLQDLKSSNKEIIIFGAYTVGKMVKLTLDDIGIQSECFFDNLKCKTNCEYAGLPVYSPKPPQHNVDYKVYICVLNSLHAKSIKEQLFNLGYTDCEIPWFLFYYYGHRKFYETFCSTDIAESNYNIKKFQPLVMDTLNLEITEKCTLRCSDCSNLMPYFKVPQHFNKDTIITSISKMADSVDIIERVSIVGGEPLLYPQLIDVLKAISNIPNILLKCIITNVSTPPKKDFLLKLKPLISYIRISDYGEQLSKFRQQWTDMMDEVGILYEVWKEDNIWTELGIPEKHDRTTAENQRIFEDCKFAGCHTIINGNYYSCSHAGNIVLLGKAHKKEDECVDLCDPNLSPLEIRKQIKSLLYREKFLSICDYCNGSDGKKIKPGIQITK